MKNIKIYYGMSGACKGTTISVYKNNNPDVDIVYSSIKSWKNYQFGIFDGMTEYNDITYGILHLVQLREFMDKNHDKQNDLIVERGITDSLFYYYYNDEFTTGIGKDEDRLMIEKAVKQEKSLLLPDFYHIERTLLIQNDKDFIEKFVMKDPYRKKTFKNNLDYYLELQDKYVSFTTKYNDIDNIIRIDNAKDY